MILMAPRSGWKSTIDGIDAVQWLLNAPDIRIMMITAFRPLAKTFLGEIKRYFYLPPRGVPSSFQLLYPEYVLTGVDGRSIEPIRCPAATIESKEPHLWITSMESSATGMRCDICKADDVVDPKNSNNEELRQNFTSEFNLAIDLVESWGFIDIIGTRYYTDDYYGVRMLPDESGHVAPFSHLCIAAWFPKPGFEQIYTELLNDPLGMSKVTEDMVDLWFPQKLSFQDLRDKLLAKKERKTTNVQKERSFRNQQLNIATDPMEDAGFIISFTSEAIRAHYLSKELTKGGRIVSAWDWAYSDKATSDYSAGVVARIYKNEEGHDCIHILEIEYGKWKSSELAHKIVSLAQKWNPEVTLIEKSNGADSMMRDIQRVGDMRHYRPHIYWKTPSNQENAKRNRIKSLEVLLSEHRLHFVLGSWMDETIQQFTQYTGERKNRGRKDDIPDAISFLLQFLSYEDRPKFGTVDPEEEARMLEEQMKEYRKQQHYEQYFGGTISYVTTNANRQAAGEKANTDGLNPEAQTFRQWRESQMGGGKAPESSAVEAAKPKDPRLTIFGKHGPWRM